MLPLLSNKLTDSDLDEPLKVAAACRELPGGRGAKSRSPSWLARQILTGKCQGYKVGRMLLTTRRFLREMMERELQDYAQQKGVNLSTPVRSRTAGDAAADAAFGRLATVK